MDLSLLFQGTECQGADSLLVEYCGIYIRYIGGITFWCGNVIHSLCTSVNGHVGRKAVENQVQKDELAQTRNSPLLLKELCML